MTWKNPEYLAVKSSMRKLLFISNPMNRDTDISIKIVHGSSSSISYSLAHDVKPLSATGAIYPHDEAEFFTRSW